MRPIQLLECDGVVLWHPLATSPPPRIGATREATYQNRQGRVAAVDYLGPVVVGAFACAQPGSSVSRKHHQEIQTTSLWDRWMDGEARCRSISSRHVTRSACGLPRLSQSAVPCSGTSTGQARYTAPRMYRRRILILSFPFPFALDFTTSFLPSIFLSSGLRTQARIVNTYAPV